MNPAAAFLEARDFLLAHRTDYQAAYHGFRWPRLEHFNWALDYFDVMAQGNRSPALHILNESGDESGDESGAESIASFAEMSERSNRTANYLRHAGVRRGDRILVMLGNEAPLWEALLAAFKLGAVVIPAAGLLAPDDVRDRVERGAVRHVIAASAHTGKFEGLGGITRIVCGDDVAGWRNFADARAEAAGFEPDGLTRAADPLLLYFTSGTTSRPKLVEQTHESYPVGLLSSLYWLGPQPGDLHWNISSPGWAKHAWSSFFVPWTAGATIFAYNYARFRARDTLRVLAEKGITTLCAPPTVWRMLVQERLTDFSVRLREAVSAGEPLNPEVIEQVRAAWGITIRDGYGQTETSALVANSPGQPVKPGSMGRPMPGFRIELAESGEICVHLGERPTGLMPGYAADAEMTSTAMRGGLYHTGDIGTRDEEGYLTYIGRADDVFKASDYRISPFELESALIEHPAVAEAAVVPCPDALRGFVPKAFVVPAEGHTPGEELARELFRFIRKHLAPYKRIRRLEFGALPKTISGKIRRAELRQGETEARVGVRVYCEEEFGEL